MALASTKTIVLATTADWDTWFSYVRARATNNGIWELVNPEIAIKPVYQTMLPVEPELNLIGEKDVDAGIYELFKIHSHVYKLKLAKWDRQQKAFTDIITFIQDTITVQIAGFITRVDPHPWNYLRTLKQHFCPTDEARGLEIEARYHRLCQGPSGDQDMDVWLQEWLATYNDGKKYGIAEVTGKRAARDFLRAIRSKQANFADNQMMLLMEIAVEDVDVYGLIEKFRQFIRLSQSTEENLAIITHSAFAASQGDQSADSHVNGPDHSAFSANSQFSSLASSASSAHGQSGPTSDSGGSHSEGSNNGDDTADIGAFSSIYCTAVSPTFALQNSWILDGGANGHVCNKFMKDRFIKQRDGSGFMAAGAQKLPIEAWGTIVLTLQTPNGPKEMCLLNVAYVPQFLTNVVCQDRLYVKGLYFDNWKLHLHKKGRTVAFVKRFNGHYLMEDNTRSTSSLATSAINSEVTPVSTSGSKIPTANKNEEANFTPHTDPDQGPDNSGGQSDGKEIGANNLFPSPSASISPTSTSSRSVNQATNPNTASQASSAPLQLVRKAPKDIEGADFDQGNILPEGVRQRARRQENSAALVKAEKGDTSASHTGYFAYGTAISSDHQFDQKQSSVSFSAIGVSSIQPSTSVISTSNQHPQRDLKINQLITGRRHVNVYTQWLRQETASKKIPIIWVAMGIILAHVLSKSLYTQRHLEVIKSLGLVDPDVGNGPNGECGLEFGNSLKDGPSQGGVSA